MPYQRFSQPVPCESTKATIWKTVRASVICKSGWEPNLILTAVTEPSTGNSRRPPVPHPADTINRRSAKKATFIHDSFETRSVQQNPCSKITPDGMSWKWLADLRQVLGGSS